MPSGKYGALSGAISRMNMLENINRSLANVNTTGYKKGDTVFEAQLAEAKASREGYATNFVLNSNEVIDFSPGQIKKTGGDNNLAINGEGFFRVQLEDGGIAYTRRGSFQRNAVGELLTQGGGRLLGANDAPLNLADNPFEVTASGSILVDGQPIGAIPIYLFDDTSSLRRGPDGTFLAAPDAAPQQKQNPEILQGYLEGSNVNVMQEMASMVYNQRVFEASQKALVAYSKMNSKLADLGSIQ